MGKPARKNVSRRLVVCIDNDGFEVSLERRKIYEAVVDQDAERLGLLRVIDASCSDYLYSKRSFRDVELSPTVKKAVLAAA